MQTLIAKNETETGNLVINRFQGRLNAKAYKLLTDNIYRDKISALIRELSTNADDSEKEAGNRGNFSVHLPTKLEPYFYIRDYGMGMSPEKIVNTYTVFFESTKDDSNEFTGCLGLGSKTPLHYNTKSCTVSSFKDGMCYVYSCFMSNDGCPSYTELSRSETNEPNGVKVEFPVKRDDVESFYDRASSIYSWFEYKPKFIGRSVQIKENNYSIAGNGWKLQVNGPSGVLMGNIFYPLETSMSKELDEYNSIIDSSILIIANIGDVEFDMSREGLSYNSKTIKYLISKFEQVKIEYSKSTQELINECKSYFDAQLTILQLFKTTLNKKLGLKYENFNFNGQAINKLLTLKDIDVPFHRYIKSSYRKRINSSIDRSHIEPELTFIVVNDIKKGCGSRLQRHSEQVSHYANYIVFDSVEDAIKAMKCSKSNIILVSLLDSAPKTSRIYAKRGTIGSWPVYQEHPQNSLCWKIKDVDFSTTKGYYIVRSRYNVNINGSFVDPQTVSNFVKLIKIITNVDIQVIGCSEKNKSTMIENGWLDLVEYVNTLKVTDKYKEYSIQNYSSEHATKRIKECFSSSYQDSMNGKLSSICSLGKGVCEDIDSFTISYEQLLKTSNTKVGFNFDSSLYKNELADKFKEINDTVTKIKNDINLLKTKYPLFKYLDFGGADKKHIIQYIKAIQNV